MENVISKRCRTPLCDTTVTNQYDGYCLRCAVHNGIEVKRNYRTKERSVTDRILESFPDHDWVVDKRVEGGCSLRRGDMNLELGFVYLIIEVDERQHRGYPEVCDRRRYHEIAADVFCTGGEHPIVFLRFNPDAYTDVTSAYHPSPWKRLQNGLVSITEESLFEWDDRLCMLVDRIEHYMDEANTPTEPLTVETMFYDDHDASNPYPELELHGRL